MEVLRTAILDFCRRQKGKQFPPEIVIQTMFPQDWEQFLPELENEIKAMQQEGLILVNSDFTAVECGVLPGDKQRSSVLKKHI